MRTGTETQNDVGERGSATVEFLMLSLVLLIPVVYLMIYVSQIQAAAFASVAAADQAARVLVASAEEVSVGQAASTIQLTLADYGVSSDLADVSVRCSVGGCGTREPAEVVEVSVAVEVPVPFAPAPWSASLSPVSVGSEARQMVPRF